MDPTADVHGSSSPDVELSVVVGLFAAAPGAESQLAAVLARYVVMSRGHDGARNLDLLASATTPGIFLVYEKWESAEAQRAHLDSEDAVAMAEAATPQLRAPPQLEH